MRSHLLPGVVSSPDKYCFGLFRSQTGTKISSRCLGLGGLTKFSFKEEVFDTGWHGFDCFHHVCGKKKWGSCGIYCLKHFPVPDVCLDHQARATCLKAHVGFVPQRMQWSLRKSNQTQCRNKRHWQSLTQNAETVRGLGWFGIHVEKLCFSCCCCSMGAVFKTTLGGCRRAGTRPPGSQDSMGNPGRFRSFFTDPWISVDEMNFLRPTSSNFPEASPLASRSAFCHLSPAISDTVVMWIPIIWAEKSVFNWWMIL